jgi:hypothetical protein
MSVISMETIVGRAEGFVAAPVRDELMMLNVAQGTYYSLDPIAAAVWSLIEEPARVQDIVDQLQQRYTVSADQCQADVLAFLAELEENGMIRVQ